MDLDTDKREFVDAVMAPIGPDAPRRALLEECLAVAETVPRLSTGDKIETATRRMRSSAKAFKLRFIASLSLTTVILGVTAWAALIGSPALRSLDEVILANRMTGAMGSMCCSHESVPSFPSFGSHPDSVEDIPSARRVLDRLPADRHLLLLGDLQKRNEVERWKAVWDRYPADPAHYFAYALKHKRVHLTWPEDFVNTGEALDPGNGWFRLLAGAEKAKSAVGIRPMPTITRAERLAARAQANTKPKSKPKPGPKKPKVILEILDPAALTEAFALLDQAHAMPRWDCYRNTLDKIRADSSPPATDFARHSLGHVLASYFQPEDDSGDLIELREYTKAFRVAVREAAAAQDLEGMAHFGQGIQSAGGRLAETPTPLVGQLIARYMIIDGCRALAEASTSLGNMPEAKRLEVIADSFDLKLLPKPPSPVDALSEHRGSGFLAKTEGLADRGTSTVTEPELRGGRLAEYAMYERFIVHLGSFALTLALSFVLIRSAFERKSLGLLPERLAGSLSVADRVVIGLVGAVLPLAVYVASTRIPSLEPREFGLDEKRFLVWLVQIAALAIAVILLSLDMAGRLMNRRLPVLAMRWYRGDPGWILGYTALASIPLASVLARFDPSNDLQMLLYWACVGFMIGMPLLWVLNLLGITLAGNTARKLHRSILLRTLVMPLSLAMSTLVASIPLLRAEEGFWIARLDFDALKADSNIFASKLEADYSASMGAQTRRAAHQMAK